MRAILTQRLVLLGLVALLVATCVACGDDSNDSDTTDTADATDTTGDTDMAADTADAPDMGPVYEVKTCLAAESARPFDIEGGVEGLQIHVDIAFDGQTAWVVFNQGDMGVNNGFDGWVQRINCDGTHASPPMRIHDTTPHIEVDPTVVVTDNDELFFLWTADTKGSPDNMEVHHSRMAFDGTMIYTDRVLETTRGGMPNAGNETSASAVALPGGKIAVGGLRTNAAGMRFEAFVQRINADGSLDGEAIEPGIEMDDSDGQPTIAARPNGDIHLAWVRAFVMGMDVGPDMLRMVEIPAGTSTPSAPPASPFADVPEGDYVSVHHGPTRSYVTLVVNGDITIADLADTSRRTTVGQAGVEHSPKIVFTENGMGLMYYRIRQGFTNDIIIQPFTDDGVAIDTSPGELRLTSTAAPYGSAATAISGDIMLAAWAEGSSPDLFAKAKFVDLSVAFQ